MAHAAGAPSHREGRTLREDDEQDHGDQRPHHARQCRGPRSDKDLGGRDEDGHNRRGREAQANREGV